MEDDCLLVASPDTATLSSMLDIIRDEEKSRKTVAAVIAISKLSLSTSDSSIATDAILDLLLCAHECSQTTAAKYLSEQKQTSDV
jgi:hypothetical protein